MATVTLIGPKRSVPIEVLVDSGATYSTFPLLVAQEIGLDEMPKKKMTVNFGASSQEAIVIKTPMLFHGRRFSAKVMYVERFQFRFSLLGRLGVFGRFRSVRFVERQRKPFVQFDD